MASAILSSNVIPFPVHRCRTPQLGHGLPEAMRAADDPVARAAQLCREEFPHMTPSQIEAWAQKMARLRQLIHEAVRA